MKTNPATITVTIDEALYNSLNRASREYEAAVVDCYYYITNGGVITDSTFTRLVDEAVEKHYEYSKLKDVISNDVVIPAIASAYGVDPEDCSIFNSWNISFDGSHKCTITNISVVDGKQETVVYSCECPVEYINNVAKLKVRIGVINEVISKLNSVILPDFVEKTAKLLKETRLDLMAEDNANTTAFVKEYVAAKIADVDKDPENLIWSINAVEGSFTLTEKVAGSNITCSSCASCN